MHAKGGAAARALRRIATFCTDFTRSAEPLSALARWCRILSRALIKDLKGWALKPPGDLLPAPA
jgi:hypothetical protein